MLVGLRPAIVCMDMFEMQFQQALVLHSLSKARFLKFELPMLLAYTFELM